MIDFRFEKHFVKARKGAGKTVTFCRLSNEKCLEPGSSCNDCLVAKRTRGAREIKE